MDIGQVFKLVGEIEPLMPRIERALATVKKLQADPDVIDALQLGEELLKIVGSATPPSKP